MPLLSHSRADDTFLFFLRNCSPFPVASGEFHMVYILYNLAQVHPWLFMRNAVPKHEALKRCQTCPVQLSQSHLTMNEKTKIHSFIASHAWGGIQAGIILKIVSSEFHEKVLQLHANFSYINTNVLCITFRCILSVCF